MTGRPPVRLHSSLRTWRPERTLAAAQALMPALGISRVAEVTRMDRLGLPVCIAVRPRGRGLRVHAGKGVDAAEARVGALMEAIEHAAAEPAASRWEARPLRVAEIEAQLGDGLRLADFAPLLGARVGARTPIPAVACEDLVSGRTVAIPAELVFLPFEPDGVAPLFGTTTNGLASGNTLEEATLHALLEVLERDALSMSRPGERSRPVDPAELPEPFGSLAAQWREAGLALAVRAVPGALGLACFEAFVHEAGGDVALAGGSGLHPDREIALARAVCEAAQSRLSHVHGGRDDVTTFFASGGVAQRRARIAQREAQVRRCFDRRRRIRYAALPHEPADGRPLGALLDALLGRLAGAGFGTVLRHRFVLPLNGLHVVKLVVPRCEDVDSNPSRIGPRLWAALAHDG